MAEDPDEERAVLPAPEYADWEEPQFAVDAPDQLVIPTGSWATDRQGNPAWMMDGWQITSHRDPVELMHTFLGPNAGKHNPEFAINRVAPIDLRWLKRHQHAIKLLKIRDNPHIAEAAVLGAEKRKALLLAVENGATITQARERNQVPPNTYAQWRKRHPDWALQVDRARHKSKLARGLDTTPESKRKHTTAEFRRHYFGYETYSHHQRIIDAIDSTPEGGFTMILVPPEAAKTTLLEDKICEEVAYDPNYRVLVVTEAGTGESSQAKKMLSNIKERMVDPDATNPDAQYPMHLREFINRYGPFREAQEDKDKPWNANYIKVHRASGRRDYTIQCAGWRSKVYGSRCNDLLFDDVQSSDSLTQTAQILHRMRGTFFSRPGKTGRIFYIGTRVGIGDVPEKLIEAGVVDNLVIIPALDADGKSYCPEMWPEEALAQKRRLVGEAAWWCNYMQDPRQAENPTFDRELLHEAREPKVRIGQVPVDQHCVISVDPALGGFTSLTASSWTPSTFQVVDFWEMNGLARNEEIFSMIGDFARRYLPAELIVEINSMQRGLARDDRLVEMGRSLGFEIVEHETSTTKWERDFGVAAMAGSFIRREIVLPDETEFCRRRLEPLLNQLEQWRPNVPAKLLRQDGVMSMWFAWRRWMEWKEASKISTAMWEHAATPWGQRAEGLSVFGAAS